jgi:hypothetical protein
MKNLFRDEQRKAVPRDLVPSYSFPKLLDKRDENMLTYLNNVSKFAEWKTQEAIEWYLYKKNPMRRYAQILRFSAILFAAFGGLSPLLVTGNMLPSTNSAWNWTLVGYVSFGLAAASIGLDKFFGFSSSWVRFVLTELALQRHLAEFQHDWAILSSKAVTEDPFDSKTCEIMFRRIQEFRLKVHSELENEASNWASEYRNNIAEMERVTQQQLEKIRSAERIPQND